ncbi:MAG: ATP-binding protein [Deltaproteobacteria bacterium]|nr:ATP-binding protein [Deltaproteobacteria bacterium]
MEKNTNNIKPLFKFIFLGALIGVFALHPLTMIIYWIEFHPPEALNISLFEFILEKMSAAFSPEMLLMTFMFSIIGVCLSLVFWAYHKKLSIKEKIIDFLSSELEKDIPSLIKRGETETLEFKSSVRWDFRQHKVNKALESVIVKTIAGFMNNKGGTLLIGLDDEGRPVGLEQDYNTLKKKNRDGYEQFIIGLIASRLAADLCLNITVMFQNFESKEICRVIVSPSQRPVYCQEGNKTQLFLRTGGGTRDLNIKEATEYIAHHWPNR